ncbi:acid cluster protein [Anaeramoeba flamelloides]|uniref:Maspardin n=1 Tax=Anaeramoeba flamelloides TaxID=1746091 RepID=A0AAV7YBA6_9EUKA|nr:acid cluster protein [Anaeramoeba flamelloides]
MSNKKKKQEEKQSKVSKIFESFVGEVALNTISIHADNEEGIWQYYDSLGGSTNEALLCLHGVPGSCDVFFQQLLSLSSRGYRVISAQYPPFWSYQTFCKSFKEFLSSLELEKIHLFGLGYGGFLIMKYLEKEKDQRIKSVILCNTFVSTLFFSRLNTCGGMITWAPEFWLKRKLLKTFPQKEVLVPIAEGLDFMVEVVEKMKYEDIASRLTMISTETIIGKIDFDPQFVTIIDPTDKGYVPRKVRRKVATKFPDCKYAQVKIGGDFPQLSNPQEVNMHLIVHLRNTGWDPDQETRLNQKIPKSLPKKSKSKKKKKHKRKKKSKKIKETQNEKEKVKEKKKEEEKEKEKDKEKENEKENEKEEEEEEEEENKEKEEKNEGGKTLKGKNENDKEENN